MEKVEDGEIELLLNTELTEIHGTPEDGIDHVTLVEHPDGHPTEKLDDPATADEVDEYDFDVGAVFFAIGHTPNTDFLEGTEVETDDEGYLLTEGGRGGNQTATGVEGCSARATWSIPLPAGRHRGRDGVSGRARRRRVPHRARARR